MRAGGVSDGRTLVRLDRVTCAYGTAPVLSAVSLEITSGDFVGVVGPSGSGKTTLLRVITGGIRPVAGTVWRRRPLTVGYVPQVETVNWDFPVTVRDVVLMAPAARRMVPWTSRDQRRQADEILERLGIGDLGSRHIRELSGGQQQRVFVARALLRDPDLLILDEPTAGVDVATRHDMLHLLAELNGQGLSILLTTHDLNGVAAHLPTLVCLNVEVVGTGPPHEVLIPEVLERTYGAELEVLRHGGMRVVIERHRSPEPSRESL